MKKRIAITPEIAKKFIENGFEINLQKDYASHLGFENNDYEVLNVKLHDNEKSVIESSETLVQLSLPERSKLENISQNKTIVGILNPYQNKDDLDKLVKNKINCFSLELLPRITRHNQWTYYHLKQIWQDIKQWSNHLVILKKLYL